MPSLRTRLVAIYALVAALNLGAWAWAGLAFADRPALLGIALLVYGLGLRHAVDADHIAAIDNVTRKLMQRRQRPVAVGFCFAIGHSTVVTLVAAAVASAASLLDRVHDFQDIGATIGTAISSLFLFAIATTNIVVFASVYRTWRRVRAGGTYAEDDVDHLLNGRGLISRLLRPLFGLVTQSWHMLALGFLFGLGFDTATEVAMFTVSATQSTAGIPLGAVLVFPILFAAGMALVDTTDGVIMLGAYEWAFLKPIRKLYYNMAITLFSVLVAIVVGGIEALGLLGDHFSLTGGFWDVIAWLGDNSGTVGLTIIGIFAAAWCLSYALYRWKGADRLELPRLGGL